MIRSQVSVVISRPIETVFSCITNPNEFSDWMPGVLSVAHVSEIPLKEGSTFKIQLRDKDENESMHVRVMRLIPNKKITLLGTGNASWFRRVIEVVEIDRTTEVHYSEERMTTDSAFSLFSLFTKEYYQGLNEEGCNNLRKILNSRIYLERMTSFGRTETAIL